MDRKTMGIGILSFTAVALLVAALMPHTASADFSIRDQNYQLVTVSGQQGSSTVYVLDSRTGKMAVFAYDMRNPGHFTPVKVGNVADIYTR